MLLLTRLNPNPLHMTTSHVVITRSWTRSFPSRLAPHTITTWTMTCVQGNALSRDVVCKTRTTHKICAGVACVAPMRKKRGCG